MRHNLHYQLNYLRVTFPKSSLKFRLRVNWISSLIYPTISVIIFLSIWELLVWFFEVPIWLVPKPSDFLNRFFSDFSTIANHGLATSITIIIGFLLGIFVAVPLALLIVSSDFLQRGLYPVIVFLNIMPKTVIGPILIVWFGIGPLAAVIIVFLMCFFPILVDSMSGFRAVNPKLFFITKSMGATSLQNFYYIRLPSSLQYIFGGMRIGIVKAVEGVMIAEFISSNEGLGFMIMRASSFMDMTLLFSGLIAAAIVALLFNSLLLTIEWLMIPWKHQ